MAERRGARAPRRRALAARGARARARLRARAAEPRGRPRGRARARHRLVAPGDRAARGERGAQRRGARDRARRLGRPRRDRRARAVGSRARRRRALRAPQRRAAARAAPAPAYGTSAGSCGSPTRAARRPRSCWRGSPAAGSAATRPTGASPCTTSCVPPRRFRHNRSHGTINVERRNLLRARQRAREALLGGLSQDRAFPPAQRGYGPSDLPEARRLGHRRGDPVREARQGLRADQGPLRRDHPRGARLGRPREDARDRHRGLRRPRGHRPDLLRPPLLPRPGQGRGEGLRAAARGDARVGQGGDRPRR